MLMVMPGSITGRSKVPHAGRSMSVSNDGDKGRAVSDCWVVEKKTVEIRNGQKIESSKVAGVPLMIQTLHI